MEPGAGIRVDRQGAPGVTSALAVPAVRVETEDGAAAPSLQAETGVDAAAEAQRVALKAAYGARVAAFNRASVRAAGERLRRMRPQPEDFLGQDHACERYAAALARFHADHYVRALQQVVDAASQARAPVFDDGQSCRFDPSRLTAAERQRIFDALRLPVAADAAVERIASACLIVATVPADLLATLVSPCVQLAACARVEARVDLEDSADPTLVIDEGVHPAMRVHLRLEAESVGWECRTERPCYRWAGRLAQLPVIEQRLAALSPVLGAVIDGRPVAVRLARPRLRLRYDGLLSAGQAWQIRHGDLLGLPNPLEPLEMSPGTSLLVRAAALAEAGLDAAHRAFADEDMPPGLAFGVLRLDGSQVALMRGSETAIERVCLFGPQAAHSDVRLAHVDLATDAGRAAYRRFLACGAVPGCDVPATAAHRGGARLH